MGRYKRRAGIYTITSLINEKVYVGHSTSVMKRLANHRNRLRAGLHNNIHLQAAWNLYGESNFVFNVIENLPSNLTKQEYEAVETKWVLKFNSHKNTHGYNNTLPGSIPLIKEDENKTSLKRSVERVTYLCIEIATGNVKECYGPLEVNTITNIPINNIAELASYWRNMNDKVSYNGRKKSKYGWMIVRKEEYIPEFDYINYKKPRKFKDDVRKTWKDYYKKEDHRKNPEKVMPYQERQLKRVPIIATNIETGEEREFPMIASCLGEFDRTKLYKCINNPFKKYKHRGHYFRKSDTGG